MLLIFSFLGESSYHLVSVCFVCREWCQLCLARTIRPTMVNDAFLFLYCSIYSSNRDNYLQYSLSAFNSSKFHSPPSSLSSSPSPLKTASPSKSLSSVLLTTAIHNSSNINNNNSSSSSSSSEKKMKPMYRKSNFHMQRLHLSYCKRISDIGLSYLPRLASTLQILDLDGCARISDVGMKEIAKLTNLHTLSLERCSRITDAGLTTLINSLTSLQHLNLEACTRITDVGFVRLASLSNTLSFLSITWISAISEPALVFTLPKLYNLAHFAADFCTNLGDATLKSMRELVNLQRLHCFGCSLVTDAGIKSGLRNLTNLKAINLNGTKITNKGVRYLRKLPKLQYVGIDRCQFVSDSAKKKLRACVPTIKELN